jgi:dipeptidyl aminopeptidase/acylaminoacyl peptidase
MNMKNILCLLALACCLGGPLGSYAQEAPKTKAPVTWKDVPNWQSTRVNASTLSPDGQWIAWASGPVTGDLTLTLSKINDTLKYDFPIGGAASPSLFSPDSKFFVYREAPKDAEAKAAAKNRRPTYNKLYVVQLSDTSKVVFDKIRAFSFSGEDGQWAALTFAGAEAAGPRGENAPKGSDVLLYHLSSKEKHVLGNVSEYAFNKAGNLLVYIVDATEQLGNGVYMRDMKTGNTTLIDQDKASYKSLRWNEEGTAFTLMKANKNEKYKTPVYSAIGVSKIVGNTFTKIAYNGIEDAQFPEGKGISENTSVSFSDDLNTLFFGIAALEKKEEPVKKDSTQTGPRPVQRNNDDIEKPDMIIWNWQDKRLQSTQRLQQNRDKNFSYMSAYHIKEKKFIPLADEQIRSINIGPKQLYAIGYDYTPYEMDNSLTGQTYVDIYVINLKTGERKCLIENYYQSASRGGFGISPNGKTLVYYQKGAFFAHNLETGNTANLTAQINSTFVNDKFDANIDQVSTPMMGWSSDSKFVLIRDNYDLYKISVDGKKFERMTNNWKNDRLLVNGNYNIYPDDKGIDFSKTQYFNIFNDGNKQMGIAILEPGKSTLTPLFMSDENYGIFRKATKGNAFIFSKESSNQAPELFYTTAANLSGAKQLTKNAVDVEKYDWSSGSKLITYVSDHGDTLQASLYLPANYEPGKSYPTITYIYERLTDELNAFAQPSFPGGGFNRAVYTSNGYAVLMPDIKYKLNDPGMSAVACVVPAVKAAIATGIVDEKNVAIHGHSWGGYQTSFLITQTNIFKAAAAGAPLTNMISMYSLIYWNSGSTNQAIFESSQGRLTTGYWDNWEAYTRNSPIYHIKNVQTPLLLLHNDKDGAVDYTQGIEYYNGLRRLNKPVVMITYNGENHGIVKEANRKDYAVRMLEFMDHYLKGKPAPDWWEKGIDHLDLEKHLKERAF